MNLATWTSSSGDPSFGRRAAVVGAGPTGLLVAIELATAGVDVVVLDRATAPDTTIKAGSINVATAEILDRRGLRPAAQAAQARFVEELTAFAAAHGTTIPARGPGRAGGPALFPPTGHFAGLFFRPDMVDQADPELQAHSGAADSVMVRQSDVEAILTRRLSELGVEVTRGVEVTALTPILGGTDAGVELSTNRGLLRVGWVVGADGGRSVVRRMLGVEFIGTEPEITGYQAIAEIDGLEGLRPGWTHTPTGVYSIGPIPGRILTVQFTGAPDRALRDEPVTVEELQASVRLVTGRDVVVRSISGRATRWTDNARQAATYRVGRVLLAGDAAHVHSPFSGQGLNLGAGDAVNLGWKLAATINGWARPDLLDTYGSERHPIGAQVLDWTRAQVALMRGDDKTVKLRRVVQQDLLSNSVTTTHLLKTTSGIAQRYAVAETDHAHPHVGSLVGDMPLADGARLAQRFHAGRFVLLDRNHGDFGRAAGPSGDHLEIVTEDEPAANCPAAYGPLKGLLVRPDGVIIWATEDECALQGLRDALARWIGGPA